MNATTELTASSLAAQSDASSLIPTVGAAYIPTEDLDGYLSSLLCNLRNIQLGNLRPKDDCVSVKRAQQESLVSMEMLSLMRVVLRFDPVEVASKIQSASVAQEFVDFMLHVSDGVHRK